ncbi:hypothetical protein AVEN_129911-1 [Araneus ventricosus]|uniref:Uncharacterized protein n=1 Tax=Araneus ventricosus TaxID=182803 RepID=A0A4Y2JTF4_ARAVE|nr:hypothetical protein AVEN_129911-1 [Araneus ventricosus]
MLGCSQSRSTPTHNWDEGLFPHVMKGDKRNLSKQHCIEAASRFIRLGAVVLRSKSERPISVFISYVGKFLSLEVSFSQSFHQSKLSCSLRHLSTSVYEARIGGSFFRKLFSVSV